MKFKTTNRTSLQIRENPILWFKHLYRGCCIPAGSCAALVSPINCIFLSSLSKVQWLLRSTMSTYIWNQYSIWDNEDHLTLDQTRSDMNIRQMEKRKSSWSVTTLSNILDPLQSVETSSSNRVQGPLCSIGADSRMYVSLVFLEVLATGRNREGHRNA